MEAGRAEKLSTLIKLFQKDEGAVEFVARGLGIGTTFVRSWITGLFVPGPSVLDRAISLAEEHAKKPRPS